MQWQECRRKAERLLAAAGIDTAQIDASLLMQHALGCDAASLISSASGELSEGEIAQLNMLVARRAAREPVAQIVGFKDFWQDRFAVSREVLTPRPDSETLIEAMLEHRPKRDAAYRILDLGTGSGCLLLSLLREYPNARGLGVDVSEAALRVAKGNAHALGLAPRCFFAAISWMQALQSRFDMIISNPPYIACGEKAALAPEVSEYEPSGALYGGEDGLEAYRQMIASLPDFLDQGGLAVIELGAGQADAVATIAQQHGLKLLAVKPDLAGIARAMLLAGADAGGYEMKYNH